ncbi:beta-lactamase/transpeptidase-like protein [Collybia nuda]|uniref:Beta-lactamase/transpeptidase-like protein n=1 Tax=Collybia nuda TaxID=64659 RepID=A0A9P5XR87_9AGAR|nr:beta-lactamase/transpeptidase-like protein [Collybia nuda]
MLFTHVFVLFVLHLGGCLAAQIPLSTNPASKVLISPRVDRFTKSLLAKWNSSGLAVAVVRKDTSAPGGWRQEFRSYGKARHDGTPVTPDTLFAIASNSKLFLSLSVGLLISNESLAVERGEKLGWTTKAKSVLPGWKLMDEVMDRGAGFQDMLSHRTGMPRHDFAGVNLDGGVAEMISNLRHLRPSAEFRETFQYNNMMYEALSHLPRVFLNQSYESYISQHLFSRLDMSDSTFSVAEAEARGQLAHGFQWTMRDMYTGANGRLIATVPYFQRPGEEKVWAGAGGVLTSTRDMAKWMKMLLNDGRHPETNATIVPEHILTHVASGLTVSEGKASYPELSPKVYGCGQWRYTYQGREIIEHGGNNPGFKSQVARFPNDDLGIIVFSNDANGGIILEAVKWRIAEEILGLRRIDWNARYTKEYNDYWDEKRKVTAPPNPPIPPSAAFRDLEGRSFSHPAYGTITPCLATPPTSVACTAVISHPTAQKILGASEPNVTTYIVPWKRTFTTHLRLTHFSGNLFNVTVVWSDGDVRRKEGYKESEDMLIGLDERFEVEWVGADGEGEEGLAFKGGIWGKEGPDARDPEGNGKDSAEIWFARN